MVQDMKQKLTIFSSVRFCAFKLNGSGQIWIKLNEDKFFLDLVELE